MIDRKRVTKNRDKSERASKKIYFCYYFRKNKFEREKALYTDLKIIP